MKSKEQFMEKELQEFSEKIIETTLKGYEKEEYEHEKAKDKASEICANILKQFTDVNKNFKLVVTCSYMQKAEYGIQISASSFWDNESDGSLTKKMEFDKVVIIVCIFGLKA